MADGDIVLQFDLKEGRNADAQVAAESLLAWIDVVQTALHAIDPVGSMRIELLGREEGSLRQLLRLVDDQLKLASDGADQFPYLKKLALGLAAALATSTLSVFVQDVIEPEVQEVRLAEQDREALHDLTTVIRNDAATSRAATRFFRSVEQDPAVQRVIITDQTTHLPLVTVDRSEFAMRGGLYSAEESVPSEQTKHEVWDVVLLQAPFYASSRHWAFSRDGLRFTAQVVDPMFLQAITDKTLAIALQEGVQMQIAVEWRERLNGQIWEYLPNTRRVVKVLSPRPTRPALPPH